MYPAARQRGKVEFEHVDHIFKIDRPKSTSSTQNELPQAVIRTEVYNIEHFDTPVVCHTGEELAICTRCYGRDGGKMCAIVLDKLDALFLFLPEFEMPINRGRDNKVRPNVQDLGRSRVVRGIAIYIWNGGRVCSLGHSHEVKDIPMHEAFRVSVCTG